MLSPMHLLSAQCRGPLWLPSHACGVQQREADLHIDVQQQVRHHRWRLAKP